MNYNFENYSKLILKLCLYILFGKNMIKVST